MITLTVLVAINLVGTWGPLIYNWWKHRQVPISVPPSALPKLGPRACGICDKFLPIDAVRTHDGKWRCADHKNSKEL